MKRLKYEDLTTGQLFQRYVEERDDEALSQIFKQKQNGLLKHARHLMGNEQDADEIVQIAFMHILEAGSDKLSQVDNVEAWLRGVVTNCSKKFIRGEVRLRDRHKRAMRDAPLASEEFRPEANSEANSHEALAKEVQHALNVLPEKYQQPITLYYLQGMAWREVAQSLGLKEDAVRKQAKRGMQRIRTTIIKRGAGVSILMLGAIFNHLRASEVKGESAWFDAVATAQITHAQSIVASTFLHTLWFKVGALTLGALLVTITTVQLLEPDMVDVPVIQENRSLEMVVADANNQADLEWVLPGWRALTPDDMHAFPGMSARMESDGTYTFIIDSKVAKVGEVSALQPVMPIDMVNGTQYRFTCKITDIYSDKKAYFSLGRNINLLMPAGNMGARAGKEMKWKRVTRMGGNQAQRKDIDEEKQILICLDPRYKMPETGDTRLKLTQSFLENDKRTHGMNSTVQGPDKADFAIATVYGVRIEIRQLQMSTLYQPE